MGVPVQRITREQARNGENGFLLEAGDITGLADAAAQLCSDTDLRHNYGARSRELARDLFDEARMVARYADIYHDLRRELEGGG